MKVIDSNRPGPLIALIAVQVLCTAFFLWDVIDDLRAAGMAFSRRSTYRSKPSRR
jgi:hypothetical protein